MRALWLCLLLPLLISLPLFLQAQVELEGVTLLETQKAGDATLTLNGAGLREKLWFDIYVCGLYLKEKSSDAAKVINSDEPMSLKLHVISSVLTSDKMVDATLEGLEKSTDGNTAPIQKEIDQLLAVFKHEIAVGDVFDLTYIPEMGVQVIVNGSLKDTIKGLAFKKALFGIWLSDDPVQKDLKEELLGIK